MILPQPWQSFRRSTCPWLPAGSTDWMTMVSPVRSPKSDTVAAVTAGLGWGWRDPGLPEAKVEDPKINPAWNITGWWYTYPSEKYESQLGWLFPIYGKIKNVPNHQPDQSPMNMAMARANRLWTYCDSLTSTCAKLRYLGVSKMVQVINLNENNCYTWWHICPRTCSFLAFDAREKHQQIWVECGSGWFIKRTFSEYFGSLDDIVNFKPTVRFPSNSWFSPYSWLSWPSLLLCLKFLLFRQGQGAIPRLSAESRLANLVIPSKKLGIKMERISGKL